MIDETAAAETSTETVETPTETTTETNNEAPAEFGDAKDDDLFAALSDDYDRITQDKDAPETESPETEAKPAEVEDDTDQPTLEADKPDEDGHPQPAIDPPQSWSADYKSKFASLPSDVQKYVAEREKQSHDYISQQGNELAKYKPVHSALEQFPEYRNENVGTMLAGLIGAQAMMDKNPVDGLQKLAEHYKVDLQALTGTRQDADNLNDDYDFLKDPRVDQVSSELTQTKQLLEKAYSEINQLKGHVTGQQQVAEQQRFQETTKAIDTFKDQAPYFAELENDIVEEVRFLRSKDRSAPDADILERAYKRAVNNSDTIRSKIEQDRKASEQAEAEKKLAKAKKQSSVNVKAKTSSARRSESRWDDDQSLESLYDQITAAS